MKNSPCASHVQRVLNDPKAPKELKYRYRAKLLRSGALSANPFTVASFIQGEDDAMPTINQKIETLLALSFPDLYLKLISKTAGEVRQLLGHVTIGDVVTAAQNKLPSLDEHLGRTIQNVIEYAKRKAPIKEHI